jgi:DNA topoisomerase-1
VAQEARSDPEPEIEEDPRRSARLAGLRYVSDTMPGIARKRAGRGFVYANPDGRRVDDPETLARIRSLAIPPAWTDVWICPVSRGHLQATGRDVRGRKQYRYHAKWREARDETKFDRMIAFGEALPRIRQRVEADLVLPGLPRERVLATIVRLLETTLIRVGNQEYARENRSFGLTTLRDKHVEVEGSEIRFQFKGKSGKDHDVGVRDRRLARIVKRCQDIPGYELFQYIDEDGDRKTIDSEDVNEYLREISDENFTAKDYRTWAGTVLAALALQEFESFDSEAQGKRNVVRAIESVAKLLGNTPTVCRKCYVHPAIIENYLDGETLRILKRRTKKAMEESLHDLRPEEAAVLALLRRRLAA